MIAGASTLGSQQQSINALGLGRQNQLIVSRFTPELLLGINEQISCNTCFSGYGSVGSFAVGGHGRTPITDQLTFLGGMSYAEHAARGVDVTASPIIAAALRYDFNDWGSARPFAEIGGWVAPDDFVKFRRLYANGSGLGRSDNSTWQSGIGGYGRLGYVWRLSPIDEVAAFGEFGRSIMHVKGYAEPLVSLNPFNGVVPTGTDQTNIGKIGAQYTHLFFGKIEVNANLGVARTFGMNVGLSEDVAGFGTLFPTVHNITFVEYGGRISYRMSNTIIIDAFIDAQTGQQPIGTNVHGGMGLRFSF